MTIDLSTLKELDMSSRDIIGTLSYIDHAQQTIQSIIANLEWNDKNIDNTQILLLALTNLIAIYMRSISKSTAFILSTLTILKRDSYLQFLLPGLSPSLDVVQKMRLASISSSFLFGQNEADLIKEAQSELEEQKKNKDLRDSSRGRQPSKSQGGDKNRKRSSSRGGPPRRRQRSRTPSPTRPSGHKGNDRQSNQPFRTGRGGKQPQQKFSRGGRSSRGGRRGNQY